MQTEIVKMLKGILYFTL